MTTPLHPLLVRLIRKVGASAEEPPSPETWREMLALVSRTFHNADEDRYTVEHSMDVLSVEMQGLYREQARKAEEELAALRLSDDRHRLLFQGNPLPIWVLDTATLRFVAVNDAMVDTYGYSRDEFVGMSATAIKQPDDVPELIRGVSEAAPGCVHHLGVRKHRCKDGTILEMDITVHAITFDGQSAILGIARDITRARRLEEDLRQAQKMEAIGQLAGGVAHDFNNILAVILANAEFGIEDLADTAGAEQFEEIRAAAERGAGLTRQLLTFSRKQKRRLQPIALNTVVTGIEAMLTRIVGEDITMSTVIAPDIGTIEADRGEIEQVVMNLVVNARDAMPQGGRVLIQTMNITVDSDDAPHLGIPTGPYVVLTISDTGCGMTAVVQARIFEPFFTTKDVDKGTGLGLSTVFGIVKQCGGAIEVRSEPGNGTVFRVYWPRVDAPIIIVADSRFVAQHGTGTVLIVEDDSPLRQILRRYLTSWGYTLLEASNGKTALELVRGHAGPIDLLLTDLVMPDLDGRSLSRHVLVEKPHSKVVFMSGYTEHAAIKNAELGPNDLFIQKPFSAQTLSETIHHAFGLNARPRNSSPASLLPRPGRLTSR